MVDLAEMIGDFPSMGIQASGTRHDPRLGTQDATRGAVQSIRPAKLLPRGAGPAQ